MDTNNNNNNNNETPFTGQDSSYLKALNKASMKITKPTRKPFLPDPNPLTQTQPQTQQPPVYNINKSDFRDVVQRLTGSPAHDRSTVQQAPVQSSTRPSSSRLQRIRPPPLIQIRPQQNDAVSVPNSSFLPPLPSVHHAAESPISAYMRVFQNSAGPTNGSEVVVEKEKDSPISTYMKCLQNSVYSRDSRTQQQQQQMTNQMDQGSNGNSNFGSNSNSSMFPNMPLSPLPFGGCVPSPRAQYGMLGSPGLLFSPTSGMPQLPPLPSPGWKRI